MLPKKVLDLRLGVTMQSETRLGLTMTLPTRRGFTEFFERLAPLNLVVRTFASPEAKVGTYHSSVSWAASTSNNRTRIGTMNRQRQQAGRTPNALRSSGTLSMARQRLECAELAPTFAAGSWQGNRQRPRREKSRTSEHSPTQEAILPLPGGEGRGEGGREFQLNSHG